MRPFVLSILVALMAGSFCLGEVLAEEAQEQVLIQVSAEQLNAAQIRELQRSLQDHGIDPGPADGTMGPLTRQGIELFQQRQGLAATGNLDERTLQSLGLDPQEFLGISGEKGRAASQIAGQEESRFQISLNLLNSAQVRRLQQQLKDNGIDPGPVDGVAGPLTGKALQLFQQRQGLAATGNLNNRTLNALEIETEEFMGLAPAFE